MKWSIHGIADFRRYCAQWDELNQRCTASPLLQSDFFLPLLDQFSDGKELLAICGDLKRPTAMTIVCKTRLGVWRTFQPSQAPVGPWIQNPLESVEALLHSLRKSLPGPILKLSITQLDPALLPRPDHSARLQTLDYIDTARVSVCGGFESYWAARGKNLRQNLRRKRNSLERENVVTKLKIISEPEEVKQAVEYYGVLETAGWKSTTNTAIDIYNAQGRFYSSMLENFCHKQRGLIFQYYYNDTMVATDLCILGDKCLIILKTTFDENFSKSSPAMLMRQEAFQYIFDSALVQEIEFYGKVMDWHTKWSSEVRTMFHVNYISAIASPFLKHRNRHARPRHGA